MRLACCAMLALAACYAPKIVGGAPCDPDDSKSCPIGQTCERTGATGVCSGGEPKPDAAPVDDAAIDAGSFCLGAHLVGSLCQATAPTGMLKITASTTISTATINPSNCTEIRAQTSGPSLCVVSADTIEIATGGTLRGIGPNPLVLLATHTITVAGTLDVASHVGETIGSTPVVGAGAQLVTGCNAIGIDGKPSDAGNNGLNGGGAGAGGSFGGLGGGGGNGRGGIKGGVAVAATVPPALIGGCPGGDGGEGLDGGGSGDGGAAGGAVYLLAGDAVTIAGKVNASGAGGNFGFAGFSSGGGGGGGGAGGMIGLEAPTLTITGQVFANGGGGGGGANKVAGQGGPGGDPVSALTAAMGGGASNGGGVGGAGSVLPKTGVAGSGGSQDSSGGGGGGGGGGVIKLFGTATTTGAMISPPAT